MKKYFGISKIYCIFAAKLNKIKLVAARINTSTNTMRHNKMKKEIAFQFDLNCRWAVYVPSTKNVNEAIDNTDEVKRVIGELADLFGGATATPSIGGWRCENGEVVVENTTIVYAFCTTEQAIKHAGDVLAIAQRLCREYSQEAVTVEYNGQVKFVTV